MNAIMKGNKGMEKYTLLDIRKEYGLTLQEVADGIGMSMSNISRTERGLIVPSAHLVHALLLFYKVSYEQIEWPHEKNVEINYNAKRVCYV